MDFNQIYWKGSCENILKTNLETVNVDNWGEIYTILSNDHNKEDVFYTAVDENNGNMVTVMIASGVNPSIYDGIALKLASIKGYTNIVKILTRNHNIFSFKHILEALNRHAQYYIWYDIRFVFFVSF
jgi:hypothetical protein